MTRTSHNIAADEFLRTHRLCLHAELVREQECPPWVMFTQDFYAPDHAECCDVCGHLHGEHYRVSLMRMDQDEMLEFDFWFGASFRGQRPDEYYLLASVNSWTHFEKEFLKVTKRFPEIQHDVAYNLICQSWDFYGFFTDEERLHLQMIE